MNDINENPIERLFIHLAMDKVTIDDKFDIVYLNHSRIIYIDLRRSNGVMETSLKKIIGDFENLEELNPTSLSKNIRNDLIKEMYDEGISPSKIADIFDLSQGRIHQIISEVIQRIDKRYEFYKKNENTCEFEFLYPRVDENVKFLEVGLMDVRAADSIRIHYDFKRDGYVIEQASTFEWSSDDEVCDPDWQEVAFIQAWGREESSQDE